MNDRRQMNLFDDRWAEFSDDRVYRYLLGRKWNGNLPVVAFICLNPSTADEREDDPTVRRCIGFARDWGFGSMLMANLFAFRATEPYYMKRAEDPVGFANDRALLGLVNISDLLVAAWGNHGKHKGRAKYVRNLLSFANLHVLGLTQEGQPQHPLYLPGDRKPKKWEVEDK